MLQTLQSREGLESRVIAVDPLESRRKKMSDILAAIQGQAKHDNVAVVDIEAAKTITDEWTGSVGCNAVLEVIFTIVPSRSSFTHNNAGRGQQQRPEAGI